MKNLIRIITLLVILLGVILIFNYCSKTSVQPDPEIVTETEGESGILSFNVPPSFDWKMSKAYDFVFSGGSFGTIEVTSVDETVIYHRGSYIENGSGNYIARIQIPSFIDAVKLNGDLTELVGQTINLDLSQKTAPINYKVDFNGSSSFVDLGDIDEVDGATKITFEGWLINNDWTKPEHFIFHKKSLTESVSIEFGGPDFSFIVSYSGFYAVANIGTGKADGECFHFAFVYDGGGVTDSDKVKAYIDGVAVPVGFIGGDPFPTALPDLSIEKAFLGKRESGTDYLDGSIDEFRIWSSARTATEVADNRFLSLVGNEADLVAYYQANEGSGLSLMDKAGNYDGTSTDVLYTVNTCNNSTAWLDDDFDGVPDVNDDYPEDPLRAYDNHWPASDTGTLVFEDLYPGFGDYDFNDMVIGYKFKTVTNALNNVVEIFSYTKVRAHGAQLDNGYGFELPTADVGLLSDLTVTGYNHTGSLVTLLPNGLEDGQTKPVVIVLDKVSNVMDKFVNTHETGAVAPPVTITVTMTPSGTYAMSDFNLDEWNPFLIIDQTRGYELHLAGQAPTDLGSTSYFGTFEDASDPGSNKYYVTAKNLPWALDFPTAFEYPFEKKEITAAYLHFKEWAESGGTLFTDWYTSTAPGYRNSMYIYTQTP